MTEPSVPRSSSSTISELDPSSDVEKASARSVDQRGRVDRQSRDIEKQLEGQREVGQDGDRASKAAISGEPFDAEEAAQHLQEEQRNGGDGAGEAGMLSRVLSRVLSHASTKSSWNPGPPPDGGLKAWMAVAGGHLVVMNTWGIINSFGVFQAYYATTLALLPSTISWIGSIQVFLLFFIGTFTGRLTDAGYFRHIFLLGSAFQVLGIFAASACTEYWQLFLAQGVCLGLGNGCLFCPAVAVLSTYFNRHRNIAIGVAACGSATGGLVFPSMVRQLLPAVGFPWTIRAIGFVQLGGLVLANLCLQTRIPARKAGRIVEWAAFKELEYTFYAAGSFFCFLGVYFAFYYLASFSRDVIGLSYTSSLNLLLILNGVGSIGRLVPNYLADRFGPINVFIPTALFAGVCVLCWTAVDSRAGLYVWASFYGMAAGGIQSLFPAGLSSLTTDLRKAGVRMGMVFTIVSFATLTGPPIDGAIISAGGGSYRGAFVFAGVVLLVGSGFMVAARTARMRKTAAGWAVKV